MERGGVPEHLGALIVLDTGPGFDVGSAQRVLAERIRAVPRLRQRLVRLPYGCGRPVWVDDPGFDATQHVRLRRCPVPGDERTLLDVAAEVISEPLPWSRPLWAAVLVPDLVDDRVGLVLVLHHVLAHGLDGLAILARLADGAEPGPPRTFPQPRPARRRLAAEALLPRLRPLGRFRAGGRVLRTSAAVGRTVPRAVACSILQVTGTRRRFAAARTDLVASARLLLAGCDERTANLTGSEQFKTSFGGDVFLYPEQVELIASPLLRLAYDISRQTRTGGRLVKIGKRVLRGGRRG
jgi:hypothetical protein